QPIPWVRVHRLPDFVYFNHAIHVNKGVGCETCHGRVDQMPLVRQASRLQMSWCLECHRHPERSLRPREEVFTMGWIPPEGVEQVALGRELKRRYQIRGELVLTSCSTCHR
ncbi:MAG TPA: cytochrome c3 family protein, partial [Thermoanaerobaculia bacterium]|nr:cytochrome c3 family protein [Thermoanaerobaculia bacterium]